MDAIKWSYFQYRKAHGYPVYLRFSQPEIQSKFLHLLNEIGFHELTEKEVKKISLQKFSTRILSIQGASSRMQQLINGSDLLDKYGHETLSFQAGMPMYVNKKVALMVMPTAKQVWDLAVNPDMTNTDQMIGLRVVLVRFLAMALAESGVLAYWGTVKDETVVVMKQANSFGEAVLIDHGKKIIFSNGGEMRLGSSFKIVRKDKDTKVPSAMGREELISFLSVSSCYLTFTGLPTKMKQSIYNLSSQTTASYGVYENQFAA